MALLSKEAKKRGAVGATANIEFYVWNRRKLIMLFQFG